MLYQSMDEASANDEDEKSMLTRFCLYVLASTIRCRRLSRIIPKSRTESTGSTATEQRLRLMISSCLSFTKLALELNQIRRYQRVIGDDGRVDMDRASCSTLRDDNVPRVTCAMCRTDGMLNQVSIIKVVLDFHCRRCGLSLKI